MNANYIYAKFCPRGKDNQLHWATQLAENAQADKAKFTTIPASIWTQLGERIGYITDTYNEAHEARRYAATLTHTMNDAFEGDPVGSSEGVSIIPAPGKIFPAADVRVKRGTIPWLAKTFVPMLMADPAWNDTFIEKYGLKPIKSTGSLEYHDFKLDVQKTADGQQLKLSGSKGGFKVLDILRRVDNKGDLGVVKTVTSLPWTDPLPLTDKPETREYQVRGQLKNEPYGAPSQIFVITARRTVKIEEESV